MNDIPQAFEDCLGRSIGVGDEIVYAVRHASSLTLRHARVLQTAHRLNSMQRYEWCIRVQPAPHPWKGDRPVWLTVPSYVTLLKPTEQPA